VPLRSFVRPCAVCSALVRSCTNAVYVVLVYDFCTQP
jgi:hypothetical protein